MDEFLNAVDDRVNIKIANGIKKAMHLIIERIEVLIQSKVKLVVHDEITQPDIWSAKNEEWMGFVNNLIQKQIHEIIDVKNENHHHPNNHQ